MSQPVNFYRRVSMVCQAVPQGKVATYGQIALLCGKPKNSRQVGYALKWGLAGQVPAHRIVNAQGYLTGAPSFETHDMQKKLLEKENIEVTEEKPGKFRVSLAQYGWKNTMDQALELEKRFRAEGV